MFPARSISEPTVWRSGSRITARLDAPIVRELVENVEAVFRIEDSAYHEVDTRCDFPGRIEILKIYCILRTTEID